jgi:hypothetical protein
MLHGGFGSARQAQKSYGWDAEADRGQFVVAYPDGLGRAWNTGGGCCGTPGRTNADDIGFITAMVSAIERQLPVDANRVYATGISNGGIMAYTLADRGLPGRADGRTDHDRRRGAPVARRYAQPAGPAAPAHRPAIHRPERHAGHLAVLRRASPLSPAIEPCR